MVNEIVGTLPEAVQAQLSSNYIAALEITVEAVGETIEVIVSNVLDTRLRGMHTKLLPLQQLLSAVENAITEYDLNPIFYV